MNGDQPTRKRLLETGCRLFAAKGFDATSIRDVTRAAGTNLGAVTYHFGSKAQFYEAVLASLLVPGRERIAAAAQHPGTPLERLQHLVRVFFEYLYEHPELPRIIVQEVARARPVPAVVRETLLSNHGQVAGLIAAGQRDGSIRSGDARLMALSIGSQPMFLNVVRQVLHDVIAVDQDDAHVRRAIVDSVVQFVTHGLASHPESFP
jgi:AcrR family transcriptional regulator